MEQEFKFEIKEINPLLIQSFLLASKEDIILQKIIQKSENLNQFVNCLISGILCLIDREKNSIETIKTLIESNPQIMEILKERNDTLLSLSKQKK